MKAISCMALVQPRPHSHQLPTCKGKPPGFLTVHATCCICRRVLAWQAVHTCGACTTRTTLLLHRICCQSSCTPPHAHQELITELIKRNPSFKPPADYRPEKKYRRMDIPQAKYPGYNFIGLIIGPRGNTQKRMEQETGTRSTCHCCRLLCCNLDHLQHCELVKAEHAGTNWMIEFAIILSVACPCATTKGLRTLTASGSVHWRQPGLLQAPR